MKVIPVLAIVLVAAVGAASYAQAQTSSSPGLICKPKPGSDYVMWCVAYAQEPVGTRVCVTPIPARNGHVRDYDQDADATRYGGRSAGVCVSLDPNPSGKKDLRTDYFPEVDASHATETVQVLFHGPVDITAEWEPAPSV
jgi:hypothetical protein